MTLNKVLQLKRFLARPIFCRPVILNACARRSSLFGHHQLDRGNVRKKETKAYPLIHYEYFAVILMAS